MCCGKSRWRSRAAGSAWQYCDKQNRGDEVIKATAQAMQAVRRNASATYELSAWCEPLQVVAEMGLMSCVVFEDVEKSGCGELMEEERKWAGGRAYKCGRGAVLPSDHKQSIWR